MAQTPYVPNRSFADKHNAQIQAILGQVFFPPSRLHDDVHNGFDFELVGHPPTIQPGYTEPILGHKVNAHVRRFGSWRRASFTVRSKVPTGNKTEFDKIKAGLGDYMIYAQSDDKDLLIISWTLIDLHRVQKHLTDPVLFKYMEDNGGVEFIDNYDGQGQLDGTARAEFDILKFYPNPKVIVAEQEPDKEMVIYNALHGLE